MQTHKIHTIKSQGPGIKGSIVFASVFFLGVALILHLLFWAEGMFWQRATAAMIVYACGCYIQELAWPSSRR